jgi:probable phosphoglycerate mutase
MPTGKPTMPTRVLLLRHAETADPSIFHGAESDVGLGDRGRRQAVAVASYLAGLSPDVVVSSAMRRARDTVTPIALACGRTPLIEPLLHERRVGPLSGTPNQLPDGPWPYTLRRWMAGDTAYAPEGAESFDDIRDRVLPVWRRLTNDHAGKTLVVVAHGVVCKVLLLTLLPGRSVADWQHLGPIHNIAVSELVFEGGIWQALRINAHVVDA